MWKLFTYSKEPAFITKYENNEDENTLWFPFGDIFCYYGNNSHGGEFQVIIIK